MTPKPRIRAFVIGPHGTELDVFYTLPEALGIEWEFEHLLLERERFTLELVADVHRDHDIRNGIVVIVPGEPRVLEYVRLGLANAWRAGVRRFILLFAGRVQPTELATDELEQELRVALDSLGDGGAAPALRAPLTRCAGRTGHDERLAMLRLLDEIERVFSPGAEPVLEVPLPAAFAREAAVLDAITPLVRSATMIETAAATLEATAALRDGAGGSHRGGWPYLPVSEDWPACPSCRQPAPCYQQFDMRDVLHAPPPAHRLYVIYRCATCYAPDNVVVRHYATPTAGARRPIDAGSPRAEDPELIVMERRAYLLPEIDLVEADHPDVVARLRAIAEDWGDLYWRAESALGMSSSRIPDHLGGWQCAQAPSHPTCACDAKLYLVASTQWGDWWNSVWACPVHPDLVAHRFHK